MHTSILAIYMVASTMPMMLNLLWKEIVSAPKHSITDVSPNDTIFTDVFLILSVYVIFSGKTGNKKQSVSMLQLIYIKMFILLYCKCYISFLKKFLLNYFKEYRLCIVYQQIKHFLFA